MTICDKCKKELKGDIGDSHFNLGAAFIYDLCPKCTKEFLKHVDNFFESEEDGDGNEKALETL